MTLITLFDMMAILHCSYDHFIPAGFFFESPNLELTNADLACAGVCNPRLLHPYVTALYGLEK